MDRHALDHEKLLVYQKALGFVPAAAGYAARWSSAWSVTDHFVRASESIVVNLAGAASHRTKGSKAAGVDCALGSALECAACLDIAAAVGLLPAGEALRAKQPLAEIARMLVGLRKSWVGQIREDGVRYEVRGAQRAPDVLFSHERLDVYRVALDFARWFRVSWVGEGEPTGDARHIDVAMTTMALNVAEGNGRFSTTDHSRFLGMAERAAIKAAAYLDIAVVKQDLDADAAIEGNALLMRVVAMLARMISPAQSGREAL